MTYKHDIDWNDHRHTSVMTSAASGYSLIRNPEASLAAPTDLDTDQLTRLDNYLFTTRTLSDLQPSSQYSKRYESRLGFDTSYTADPRSPGRRVSKTLDLTGILTSSDLNSMIRPNAASVGLDTSYMKALEDLQRRVAELEALFDDTPGRIVTGLKAQKEFEKIEARSLLGGSLHRRL